MIRAGIHAAVVATGEQTEEFDPNTVTPGVIGFFVMFGIAAVAVLLVLDMVRRVRRTRYRVEIGERLDAEEAALLFDESNLESRDEPGSAEGRRVRRDDKDPDPVA